VLLRHVLFEGAHLRMHGVVGAAAAAAAAGAHDHVELALEQRDLLLVAGDQGRLVHDLVALGLQRDLRRGKGKEGAG
jgi:formamidopyrimidine-DNA glycosylase